jgi:hypothetical protein
MARMNVRISRSRVAWRSRRRSGTLRYVGMALMSAKDMGQDSLRM